MNADRETDFSMRDVPPEEIRYAPDVANRALRAMAEARYRFACQQLPEKGTALDLGCGPGYGSRILAEKARRVIAVDYNAQSIAMACQRYPHPHVKYICSDVLTYSPDISGFDLVTAFELIEHLEHPEVLLRRAWSVLRPGGVLVFSTPNKLVHLLMGVQWPWHVREYGYSELAALLENHFPEDVVEILGQNPRVIQHFRERKGRFEEETGPRAVLRKIIPRPLVAAGKRLPGVSRVLSRTRRFSSDPGTVDDPAVTDSCRITREDVDVCATFIGLIRKPVEESHG